jgi:hypothetical protein
LRQDFFRIIKQCSSHLQTVHSHHTWILEGICLILFLIRTITIVYAHNRRNHLTWLTQTLQLSFHSARLTTLWFYWVISDCLSSWRPIISADLFIHKLEVLRNWVQFSRYLRKGHIWYIRLCYTDRFHLIRSTELASIIFHNGFIDILFYWQCS